MGVTQLPAGGLINFSAIGQIREVFLGQFGSPFSAAGNSGLGFATLFSDAGRIPLVIITIIAFSLSDTFDTIGTFIGTGRKTGIFDDADEAALEGSTGFKSRMDKALFADATATSMGSLLGKSNTTTYIESARRYRSRRTHRPDLGCRCHPLYSLPALCFGHRHRAGSRHFAGFDCCRHHDGQLVCQSQLGRPD